MMYNKQLKGIGNNFIEVFLIILNFVLFLASLFSFILGYWWLGIILIVAMIFSGSYVKEIQDERIDARFRRTAFEIDQDMRYQKFESSIEAKQKEMRALLKDKTEAIKQLQDDKCGSETHDSETPQPDNNKV